MDAIMFIMMQFTMSNLRNLIKRYSKTIILPTSGDSLTIFMDF